MANNIAEQKKASLDLAGMMDDTLDAIPDAPDFTNPPAGDYTLQVKSCAIETYTPKSTPGVEAQRVRITYSIIDTKSLANPNEQPVPNESMFSETFMGTEEGIGYFKKAGKAIMNVSDLGGVTFREILSSVTGMTFDARVSVRNTPKPGSKTEFYENVSIRVIPPVAS